MSDPIIPESRIFRIGRECYIVYLGKERDDFRPFLRIGNTRDIPDEVHQVVSTTVVTDDHIGNPLIEILLVPKFQGRYLGDTSVVATIRRFFKSFDLPTDDVTDYRKVKDGERRHMVWFYSSGNIHLRYDDRIIFDLKKREKEDRHFVRLYEEAKTEFLKNPLRYIRQDFSGQGIVLSGGNAFWYEGGELFAFAAHPGFVARLMSLGVDPDFITASAYNLSSDQMDSHDAAVFIGFIKRMRQRRKQLRVVTSTPEILRKLRFLFPGRGNVPATLEVTDVSGKRKATFRDSIISLKDDNWHLHRAGLPEVAFDVEIEKGISIDIQNVEIKLRLETAQISLAPPEGFPLEFIGHDVPENHLLDKYLAFTLNNVKDSLNASETQAAMALERYLKMFRDDILAGKTSVSPLLKQTGGTARDALRHCSPENEGLSWFFFSNTLNILNYFIQRLGRDHGLVKSGDQVSAAISDMMSKLDSPNPLLPFWGDLYIGEHPCLLWRASKRGVVPADIASAREAVRKINSIASLDETPWIEDRERLMRLIRSLNQGGQGPLTEEQLTILSPSAKKNKSEEDKKTEQATAERKESPGAERGSNFSQRIEKKSEASADAANPVRKSSSEKAGKGRIWLLLLLFLFLLSGAAILWDLSGRAPWGRYLASGGKRNNSSLVNASETGDAASVQGIESSGVNTPGSGSDAEVVSGSGDTDAASGSAYTDASSGSNDTDAAPVSVDDSYKSSETDAATVSTGDSGGSSNTEVNSSSSTDDSGNLQSDNTPGNDSALSSGSETDSEKQNEDSQNQSVQVDSDIAPKNNDEVKAYLNVVDRVAITEVDIHLAANEIAVLNGYKDLDYRVFTGEDPNWIFPGKILHMPGTGDYTIKKGDTIWFLAAREVRVDTENNIEVFDRAVSILDNSQSESADKEDAAANLKSIAKNARAAALREMAENALSSRNLQ